MWRWLRTAALRYTGERTQEMLDDPGLLYRLHTELGAGLRCLRQALSVARKDLAIELRTKESLNAAGAFAIAILLLFSFAFDPAADDTNEFGGGLLWLVFAFAGALVFNRGFRAGVAERMPGCAAVLAAFGRQLDYGQSPGEFGDAVGGGSDLARGLRHLLRCALAGSHLAQLAVVFALVTWGISMLGAVFGALTVNLRLRELMLPVIIYPLMVPLLIAAIEITNALLAISRIGDHELLWVQVCWSSSISYFQRLACALADTIW